MKRIALVLAASLFVGPAAAQYAFTSIGDGQNINPSGGAGTQATATGLPGTTFVVTNLDAANTAYCRTGTTAAATDQPIPPNGGWFAFSSAGQSSITCFGSSGSVNVVSGSGQPSGTGGGSGGGGGGGAVTAVAGAFAAGSIVDLGPFSAAFDSLPTPSGTINTNNALVSIYEALLNPGKISGFSGVAIDAAPGSNATNALAVQGITGGKPIPVTVSSSGPQTVSTANITGIAASGTFELITATSGQGIYILAGHISVDGADNVTLEYGQKTTTGCDTGTTVIDGPEYWAAGWGWAEGSGGATLISIPAATPGNELCAVTTTTAHLFGRLTYVKQ